MPLFKEELRSFIRSMLDEDVGRGDLTTLATIPADAILKAEMNARETMVIAGIDIAEKIIHTVDPAIIVEIIDRKSVV